MNARLVMGLCCCIAFAGLLGCGKPKTPPTSAEIGQFFSAAATGDVASVNQLLSTRENRALLDAKEEKKGRTALHLAAGRGQVEVMKVLIDKGAAIEAGNDVQSTPLHIAAAGDQKAAAELLITKGANVDAKDNVGCTPLAYAALLGRAGAAELLLTRGADPNARISDGESTLTLAMKSGHGAVADIIRKHGGTQ